MSDQMNVRFSRLIHALSLRDIRPMKLHSERLGDLPLALQGTELKLAWNQSFADGDPLTVSPEIRVFRPKYEFSIRQGENYIFRQESIFIIAFSIADVVTFDELWTDEELRKTFMAKQIQRIMWPLFRQHVHDGMSRLGMSPVPLPLLM